MEEKTKLAQAVEGLGEKQEKQEQEAPKYRLNEKEKAWIALMPQGMQRLAERHSCFVLQLVMQAGAVNIGVQQITKYAGNNRRVIVALGVIGQALESLAQVALDAKGFTLQDFLACRADVERVAALMEATTADGQKRTASGIIVPTKH